MIAEAVFVGTELLMGEILNTNARYLSRRLAELGVDQYYQVTVGDNPDRLESTLRLALGRSDLVITSGGLGPTPDDLTREVAARVSGRDLHLDAGILAELEEWFQRTGRPMTENNRRQAMVPEGAAVLQNPVGTAPGLIIPAEPPEAGAARGKVLILLPGPPHEFQRMLDEQVLPYLAARLGGQPVRLYSRILRFSGIGESALASLVGDVLEGQTDPTVAPYAKLGEVHLRLATKAASPEAAEARFAPVVQHIRERAGAYLYGYDETELEEAVGALLRQRGETLALAESCTGGLVAQRITSVPGSSDYFLTGYVTYSNQAKMDLLGVPAATLEEHGAVSEATVRAMALGARERSGATWAVSISGIAGPGGGSPEKPVGTVWIGLAGPLGVKARRFQFRGGRAEIRAWAAQYALSYLWSQMRTDPTR